MLRHNPSFQDHCWTFNWVQSINSNSQISSGISWSATTAWWMDFSHKLHVTWLLRQVLFLQNGFTPNFDRLYNKHRENFNLFILTEGGWYNLPCIFFWWGCKTVPMMGDNNDAKSQQVDQRSIRNFVLLFIIDNDMQLPSLQPIWWVLVARHKKI